MESTDISVFVDKMIITLNKCEEIKLGEHWEYRFDDFKYKGPHIKSKIKIYCDKCKLIFSKYQTKYAILYLEKISIDFDKRLNTLSLNQVKMVEEIKKK